jgi:hypothetical protein
MPPPGHASQNSRKRTNSRSGDGERVKLLMRKTWQFGWALALSGLVLVLASCGGTGAAPVNGDTLSAVAITISPANVALHTGTVEPFTATVSNTTLTKVTWLVDGIAGGNSSVGTIDKQGNYTAPPYVPVPSNVTVTAVAMADESKFANAAVSLTGPAVPGSVSITPQSATVYVGDSAPFRATVNGADPAVTWQVNGVEGGNAQVGTIEPIPGSNNQALYTAPLQVPDVGQVVVAALSVANPQQAASAIVTVSLRPAGGAVVTITNPPLPPTVQAGQTQAFDASVTGVSNTTVAWQVDAIPGGNATVGTITAGPNDSATYTAPQSLPNPPSVTVIAVSNAQPSAQASLAVNLVPVQNVTVAVSADPCTNPNGVTINTAVQFTAVVTGNSNQSVTWQVNQVNGGNSQFGTISPSGEYTAPANVPNPSTVTVSAVSNAVPSVSGSEIITLVANPILQVLLAPVPPAPPPYPEIYTGGGQEFQATVQGATDSLQAEVNWLINGYSDGDGGIYGSFDTNPLEGCISTATYSAPDTIPNPSQFPLTAQSAFNSNQSASITVTIINAPQVKVTVDPTSANVPQTDQQIFNVTITGNSNLNAYWALSSKQCSGTACGTLTTSGPSPSTTYTAPAEGTPAVTLTATSQGDPSAQGTAAITVTCGGPPSISLFPSSATIPAGSASPLSFSAIISPCGNQSLQVNWQLGCISLFNGDPGEDCFDGTGQGGPGCTQINNGFKVCGNRANVGPGTDPLSYFAPTNLFTSAFAPNACEESNNGSGDGAVPLTATVQLNGCPQQGCQATACITVTPP